MSGTVDIKAMANKGDVAAVQGEVDSVEVLAAQIVDSLGVVQNDVSAVSTLMAQLQTALDNRATKQELADGLAPKADTAYVDTITYRLTHGLGCFFGRINKTGMSQTISNGGTYNIFSAVTLPGDLSVLSAIDANKFSIANASFKLPAPDTSNAHLDGVPYLFHLRLSGTVSTIVADRTFFVELRRPDGTVLLRDGITVLASQNNLQNEGTTFVTYTKGAVDPFITDGLRLVVNNTSGGSITVTGFSLLFFGLNI